MDLLHLAVQVQQHASSIKTINGQSIYTIGNISNVQIRICMAAFMASRLALVGAQGEDQRAPPDRRLWIYNYPSSSLQFFLYDKTT